MEKNFSIVKNDILGKKYELSIALVSGKKSRELNNKYRHEDKPTNILSFALTEQSGEIILCPTVAKKEAKKFGKSFEQFLGFLVIHGMLHLKGLEHSSRMEEAQDSYFEKYDQKYFGGHRCGIVHDASRGRRIFKGRKKS